MNKKFINQLKQSVNNGTLNENNVFFFNWNPEKSPEMNKLSGNKKYVIYDDDNLLPQRILDITRLSPTHGPIINKKAKYTAGSNIKFSNPAAEVFAKTIDDGEGIHALIKKMALDYHLFGGFCLNVIWKTYADPNTLNKQIHTFQHQDWSMTRVGWNENEDRNTYPKPTGVWISPQWERQYKFKPKYFPLFTGKWSPEPTYLYYKKYTQGMQYYPLPDWYSCLASIQAEVEIENFIKNNMRNSFVPCGIFKFPENIKPEQRQQMKLEMQQDMKGTNNAGNILNVFGEIEWIPMSAHPAEKDMSAYINSTTQYIITGHELPSPTIVGLPGGASLSGDGNTIARATQEFFNTLIDIQKIILKTLEELFFLAGYPTQITIVQNIPGAEETTKPEETTS